MKLIITENQLRGIVGEMSDIKPSSLVLGFFISNYIPYIYKKYLNYDKKIQSGLYVSLYRRRKI